MEANSTAIVWYKEQRQGKPKLTVIVTGEGAESIHELFDLMKPNNRPFIYSQGELYGDPKSMRKVEEHPEEAAAIVSTYGERDPNVTTGFQSSFPGGRKGPANYPEDAKEIVTGAFTPHPKITIHGPNIESCSLCGLDFFEEGGEKHEPTCPLYKEKEDFKGILTSDGVEDYGSIAPKKDWVEMLGLREPFGWFVWVLGMAGVAWVAIGVFS
ncbi:hypothetical protein LCGC14_1306000 [marine sediment metagenome]|uniref:Uncharacterized protein n=1 Tax=marine sediment metagenome TaxID=412755 RepID=A0A0F9N4W6_9ZZZZ